MSLRTFLFGLALGVPAIAAVTPKNIQTPVVFSENRGQYPEGALYGATGRGYSFGIERDRATLRLNSGASAGAVTMRLVGAQSSAIVQAGTPAGGYQNVFIGNDPAKWAKGLPFYANVRVNGVYRGIDVNYHGSPEDLEYDFIVAPGADPGQIRLAFDGASGVRLTSEGSLELTLPGGKLMNKRPVLYQMVEGKRVEVAGTASLNNSIVTFHVAEYDRTLPLVIDPVVQFGEYLDVGQGTTRAATVYRSPTAVYFSDIFIAGSTCLANSESEERLSPCPIFISRVDFATRVVKASLIIGGSGESRVEAITAENGSVYITGATNSLEFPTTSGAYAVRAPGGKNAFVSALSLDLTSFLYSTYLGGSGDDSGHGICVVDGKVIVVGSTYSNDFPTVLATQTTKSGGSDAFVTKFNAQGSALDFSTYLGGRGDEVGAAVTARDRDIVIAGNGARSDFPISSDAFGKGKTNAESAFIARFSTTPLIPPYTATLLGNESSATANVTAVYMYPSAFYTGASDRLVAPIFVTGSTNGDLEIPAQYRSKSYGGGSSDAFLLVMDGLQPYQVNYFGGTGNEEGQAITLDDVFAYVAGSTNSEDFALIDKSTSSRVGGNDGLFRSLNAGLSWAAIDVPFTDVPVVAVAGNSSDVSLLYAVTPNRLWRSSDQGRSWSSSKCQTGATYPFSMAKSDANYIYWASGSSTDGGNTCAQHTFTGRVTAIAVDPSNALSAYLAVSGSGLMKTTDGGRNWTNWNVILPLSVTPSVEIADIAIYPGDPRIIYLAVVGDGVYRTEDGGTTWNKNILQVTPGTIIRLHPSTRDLLFVMSSALYRSSDAGRTWIRLNETPGYDLIVTESSVFMSSARGVLRSSDNGVSFAVSNQGITNRGGRAIAVDANDTNLIYSIPGNSTDGFVVRVKIGGDPVYATYLGAPGNDNVAALVGFFGETATAVVLKDASSGLNRPNEPSAMSFQIGSAVKVSEIVWGGKGPGTVTVTFESARGLDDIDSLHFYIWGGSGEYGGPCHISYQKQKNYVSVNIVGNQAADLVMVLGSGEWISNLICTVQGTGTTIEVKPGIIKFTLNVSFSSDFDGEHKTYKAIAIDSAGMVSKLGPEALTPANGELGFVPITPCRVVDTRGPTGPFGGPALQASKVRVFPFTSSPCNLPKTARAYSVNATVVPSGSLGYLTLWAAGAPQPFVSNLNSLDGRVKANAAVVSAGTNGDIAVYAEGKTELVLDVNGYFVDRSDTTSLPFVSLFHPCRAVDTRRAAGSNGGPSIPTGGVRSFSIGSACGLSYAAAYAINITAIPKSGLPFLSVWPTGEARPYVSTLNVTVPGTVVANTALVKSGIDEQISVYAERETDIVIDLIGIFSRRFLQSRYLTMVQPCRAIDTRLTPWKPALNGVRSFPLHTDCETPPDAFAYLLNATVVPYGPLGYLTLWPTTVFNFDRPSTSTLNSFDGSIVSNFAIQPSDTGRVNAFTTSSSELILDLFGYFAR